LRDGLAKCEDKCMGLSDESPDDDSDVVGGYKSKIQNEPDLMHLNPKNGLAKNPKMNWKKTSDDLKNEVMHTSMLVCKLV
ncbi:hypothetical protein Tco_0456841, partial [Tanacetum coccineum]